MPVRRAGAREGGGRRHLYLLEGLGEIRIARRALCRDDAWPESRGAHDLCCCERISSALCVLWLSEDELTSIGRRPSKLCGSLPCPYSSSPTPGLTSGRGRRSVVVGESSKGGSAARVARVSPAGNRERRAARCRCCRRPGRGRRGCGSGQTPSRLSCRHSS
jgi:hypothetical protein